MRSKLLMCLFALSALACAKEPRPYQTGSLLLMDSVKCGVDEKDGNSLASEIVGTDSTHKKTLELLCQEYVLQTEEVVYRIRPRDEKHPMLLPVGSRAQFRLQKDRMLVRVEGLDSKEREYVVLSMKPRAEGSSAEASASRVNHLQ